jgi:hypothetical protein
MIIHFFPIFDDFSIKSYDFSPKYLIHAQLMGQTANIAHFVAFFISFQNIVTLKLPVGANKDC